MPYYSYRHKDRRDNGCLEYIIFTPVFITLIVLLFRGCVDIVDDIGSSINSSTISEPKKIVNLGEVKMVSPALLTSMGGIYQDPDYPNHYFDIRTTCDDCKGVGYHKHIGNRYFEKDNVTKEKCVSCYGTGYKKRLLSEMPEGTVPYIKE